jgi:hypothetical protein
MAVSIIDQNKLLVLNVPIEGRSRKFGKVTLPISLNWVNSAAYSLNLQNVVDRDFIDCVKTLWIDNSKNLSSVTIVLTPSLQTITFPAGLEGYVEVIAPNPLQISFTSGGVNPLTSIPVTQVQLLNYVVAGATWDSGGLPIGSTINAYNAANPIAGQIMFTVPVVFTGNDVLLAVYCNVVASSGGVARTIAFNCQWTDASANIQNSTSFFVPPTLSTTPPTNFPSPVMTIWAQGGTKFLLNMTTSGTGVAIINISVFARIINP